MLPRFVAIDFETADREPDSACALGLVEVDAGVVVGEHVWKIRPPREEFLFTHVHHITWEDVKSEPSFAKRWEEISAVLARVRFFVAHNASFDRRVMAACCEAAGVAMPQQPWLCTLDLARRVWPEPRHSLDKICAHLGIPLQHHEPLSDARASAALLARAGEKGEQRIAALGLARVPPEKAIEEARSLPALALAGASIARLSLPEPALASLRHAYKTRRDELLSALCRPVLGSPRHAGPSCSSRRRLLVRAIFLRTSKRPKAKGIAVQSTKRFFSSLADLAEV